MTIIDAPFYEEEKFRNLKVKYQSSLYNKFNSEDALSVLESSEDTPISLRDIYVPLKAGEDNLLAIKDSEEVEKLEGKLVNDILKKEQFVIFSGLAGSGKSVLTKYLSISLSQSHSNKDIQALGRKIVIPITLRELDFSKISNMNELWEAWINDMSKRLDISLTRDFFDFYIQNGWAIIIFDGFDELGDAKNKKLIEWINSWVKSSTLEKDKIKTNIVLTSRPTGFLENVDYSLFKKVFIQPFDKEQIKDFVGKFFSIRYHYDDVKKKRKIKDFLDKLDKFKGLIELKHRPIYLSMLGHISEVDGEIPNSRALAYKKMIEAYVYQLDLNKNLDHKRGLARMPTWDRMDRVKFLEEFAYKLHTKASKDGLARPEQLQIQIERKELRKIFKDILENINLSTITKDTKVEDLEQYFLSRTGLLVEPKSGFIQFSHLSFQEFLTAKFIHRKQPKRNIEGYLKKEIFDKMDSTGWMEVAQLFFGIDTMEQGEEQSEILHFLIKMGNTNHYKFIYDLIFITDNTLTIDDKKRWLKTLCFLFINSDDITQSHILISEFEADLIKMDLHKDIISYLEKSIDSILSKSKLDISELIEIVDSNDEDLAFRIKNSKVHIKQMYNILYIGCFLKNIKEYFLEKKNLDKLSIGLDEIDCSFVLDRYIEGSEKKVQNKIANIIVNNITPLVFIQSNSSVLLLDTPIFVTDKLYMDILKIQLCINRNLLFLLLKSFLVLDIKGNDIFKSIAMTRSIEAENKGNIAHIYEGISNKIHGYRSGYTEVILYNKYIDEHIYNNMITHIRHRLDTSIGIVVDAYRDMPYELSASEYKNIHNRENLDMHKKMYRKMKFDMYRARDVRSLKKPERLNLSIKNFLFSIYVNSKWLAIKKNLDINMSRDEYSKLYLILKNNPIEYFKKHNLDKKQQKDIEDLFKKSSLLKTMKYTLNNTDDDFTNEEKAIRCFHDDIKSFVGKSRDPQAIKLDD